MTVSDDTGYEDRLREGMEPEETDEEDKAHDCRVSGKNHSEGHNTRPSVGD